jgi:hypothetical protein
VTSGALLLVMSEMLRHLSPAVLTVANAPASLVPTGGSSPEDPSGPRRVRKQR